MQKIHTGMVYITEKMLMVGLKYYKWPSNLIVRTHQWGRRDSWHGHHEYSTEEVRVNAVCRVRTCFVYPY